MTTPDSTASRELPPSSVSGYADLLFQSIQMGDVPRVDDTHPKLRSMNYVMGELGLSIRDASAVVNDMIRRYGNELREVNPDFLPPDP